MFAKVPLFFVALILTLTNCSNDTQTGTPEKPNPPVNQSATETPIDNSPQTPVAANLDPETEALFAKLDSGDDLIRLEAAEKLGGMGEKSLPGLILRLSDSRMPVREAAARALRFQKADAATVVPHLIKSLEDSEVKVRVEAEQALGNFGPAASDAVPALLNALAKSQSPFEHSCIIQTLGKLGPKAIDPLLSLLAHVNPQIRILTLRTLELIHDSHEKIVPKLIQSLTDNNLSNVRAEIVNTLSKLGTEKDIKTIVAALYAVLEGEHKESLEPIILEGLGILVLRADTETLNQVSQYIVARFLREGPEGNVPFGILIKLAYHNDLVIKQITTGLGSTSPYVQLSALFLIGRIGERASDISMPTLRQILIDGPEETLKREALQTIIKMGQKAPWALPELILIAEDENNLLQDEAQTTLKALRDIASNAQIDAVLSHSDKQVRKYGLKLKAERENNATYISTLLNTLTDTSPELQQDAIQQLISKGEATIEPLLNSTLTRDTRYHKILEAILLGVGDSCIPHLIQSLDSMNSDIKAFAVVALGNFHPTNISLADVILPLLLDSNKAVRIASAYALANLKEKPEVVVPNLHKALKAEKDPQVLAALTLALGQMGVGSKSLVDDLTNQLNQSSREVVLQSVVALGNLGKIAEPSIPNLHTLFIKETDPSIRESILRTLGKLKDPSEKTHNLIADHLKDPNPKLRRGAIYSLGEMGQNPRENVELLMKLLKEDPDTGVRAEAARSLGKFGENAAGSFLILSYSLLEVSPQVKESAGWAITQIPSRRADSARLLAAVALTDELRASREAALLQLSSMGNEYISQFIGHLDAKDKTTVARVQSGILFLVKNNTLKISDIIEHAKLHKTKGITTRFATTIHQMGDIAIQPLMDSLGNQDANIRVLGIETLSRFGEKSTQAVPILLAILSNENEEELVRVKSIHALSNIASPAIIPMLYKVKRNDPELSEALRIEIERGIQELSHRVYRFRSQP